MDSGQRGRGCYRGRGRGGRGQGPGIRGQDHGGPARHDNERCDHSENQRGGHFHRGRGCPQRGGRGGGPNAQGRENQFMNNSFQQIPPPMVQQPGFYGQNMYPSPVNPDMGAAIFNPNIRPPSQPHQMPFHQSQMPPMTMFPDTGEWEITYRVRQETRPQVAQQPVQPLQQPFQHQPGFHVPPAPQLNQTPPHSRNRSNKSLVTARDPPASLLGQPPPMPHSINRRSESLMNISHSPADNRKGHGNKQSMDRCGSHQNLSRSTSVQNVRYIRGGKQKHQRERGTDDKLLQNTSYSKETMNQSNGSEVRKRSEESLETIGNENCRQRPLQNYRGRRRGRGRGYSHSQLVRDVNSDKTQDETEFSAKEKGEIPRNRGRGRGRGRWRGRIYNRNNQDVHQRNEETMEVDSDTESTSKAESDDECNYEESSRGDGNISRNRQGRGRGRGFYPRGSIRARDRFRNRLAKRVNRLNVAAAIERTTSESSDLSVVSTETDTTEVEQVTVAGGDPARAGVDGIETISIQTLRNRLNRYRKKLNDLKKVANPNASAIEKLEKEIAQIDIVLKRRINEERENKTNVNSDRQTEQINSESRKAEDTASVSSYDDSDENTIIQRSAVRRHRNQAVTVSKIGRVKFHPKANIKGRLALTKTATEPTKEKEDTEENFQNVDSGEELLDSADKQDKTEDSILENIKKKKNRRRNKSDGNKKPADKTDAIPDWQRKLNELCVSEPEALQKDTVAVEIAKPKAPQKQKSKIKHNADRQHRGSLKDDEIDKSGASIAEDLAGLSLSQERNTDHRSSESKTKGNRQRSESCRSESSTDEGPDAIEVFKFIVKEMKAEACPVDIKSKCSLFKASLAEIEEWFKRHARKFATFKKDKKIIRVCVFVKDAEYCLDYITQKGCVKSTCSRYHICKNLLCGFCRFGEGCRYSHDALDKHNGPISNQLGFSNVFNNDQIIQILSMRFPRVCEAWNTNGDCADSQCCKLHLCQKHVLGYCLDGDGCPFEHSLATAQNKMVTDAYHMTKWNSKLFNKIIFVQRRLPASVSKNENDDASEENEVSAHTGTDENTTSGSRPRPAPRKLHTRPERKVQAKENTDDTFIRLDGPAQPRYICEKQLAGQCDSRGCPDFHGDIYGLPYIWQVKLYGKWISLPEGQTLKVEEDFCSLKYMSGSSVIASEDGLYQEYHVVFHPAIFAYTKHLDMDSDKMKTQARRLSTQSYAEGDWKENSFKTQWRWFYDDDLGKFIPFDTDKLQYTMEKKYLSGQKMYLYSRENYRFKYCLDFHNMTQVNLDTRKTRKLFRRPLMINKADISQRQYPACLKCPVSVSVPLPEGWAPWDLAYPFELVELESSHQSYKMAEEQFFKTLDKNDHVIDRVYRVQNPHLWKDFMSQKETMSEKAARAGLSPDVTELILFHGTDSLDTVRGIAINNFDHRLSGKNATVYGEGAYFAKTSKYSHAYTKPPDRFMFLARVLVGEYTRGDRTYKRPPAKPGAAHELYDSCVDNITSPSIYIVFDLKQYYPEFLIQYRSYADTARLSSQPVARMKPVIQPKPVIQTKPAVPPKPSGGDVISSRNTAYRSASPLDMYLRGRLVQPMDTDASTSASGSALGAQARSPSPKRHYSTDTYASSHVSQPVRRRTPSPPLAPLRYPYSPTDTSQVSYPPSPITYPSTSGAMATSPPRQSPKTPSADTSYKRHESDKDKSCVLQ